MIVVLPGLHNHLFIIVNVKDIYFFKFEEHTKYNEEN